MTALPPRERSLTAGTAGTPGTRGAGSTGNAVATADGVAEAILSTPGRWWGAIIAFLVGRVLWSTRSSGVPVAAQGPLVLAINHVNIVDGPIVYSRFPRHVHFLVKTEMFRGVFGFVLRQVGQIPIDRGGPDRVAMSTAVHALRDGRVIGVFPEGARGRGDVAEVRTGIAWLAMRSGAPVLPVAVLGTRVSGERAGSLPPLRRRVHVVCGRPFTLDGTVGGTGRAALTAAAEQVRVELADHVAQACRDTGVALPDDSGRDPA